MHADIVSIVGVDGSTSRRTLSQVTLPPNADAGTPGNLVACMFTLGILSSTMLDQFITTQFWGADQLAAFIYNLLSTGQTSGAASAIAQASSQGATGADAISTALATAASTVVPLLSH